MKNLATGSAEIFASKLPMKKILLSCLLVLSTITAFCRAQFVTRWELQPGARELIFAASCSQDTDYFWEDLNSGAWGSGIIPTSPSLSVHTIAGVPRDGNIRLSIASDYLTGFGFKDYRFVGGYQWSRALADVEDWGTAIWETLDFFCCSNLKISARSVPNLSGMTSLASMFMGCSELDHVPNISSWDISRVTDLSYMFYDAHKFNDDISSWDVSQVDDFSYMFRGARVFNQPIGNWLTSSANNFSYMFYGAHAFNQEIETWDVAHAKDFSYMFGHAVAFNQRLNKWNMASAEDLSCMFYSTSAFNQDLDYWNTSNVRKFDGMFGATNAFNRNINTWNTQSAESMAAMFAFNKAFNQPLDNWNTENVKNFSGMFYMNTAFNSSIANWNTSSALDFTEMFFFSNFNQPISAWDVRGATQFSKMFYLATSFNQDLSGWKPYSGAHTLIHAFSHTAIDCFNYDQLLKAWASDPLMPASISLFVLNLEFTAVKARQYLIQQRNWYIFGDTQIAYCDAIPSGNRVSMEYSSDKEYEQTIEVLLYPNPNQGSFRLKGQQGAVSVTVLNMSGQVVHVQQVVSEGEEVQLGTLPAGQYIVQTLGENGLSQHKMFLSGR